MQLKGKIVKVNVSTDKEGKPRRFQGKDDKEYEVFAVQADVRQGDSQFADEMVFEHIREVNPNNELIPFQSVIESCEDVIFKVYFTRREYGGNSFMSAHLAAVTQNVN